MNHTDYVPDPAKGRESWTGVFVCNDGGGFTLDTEVSYSLGEVLREWGEWSVLEGTGPYIGLTGVGKTEITCEDPEDGWVCHEDHDGRVHLTE